MMQILTNGKFNELLESQKLFVLYFGNNDCGGCKMMFPNIKTFCDINNLPLYYVDTSKENSVTNRLHINSIPTTVIIKNGKIIAKENGYRSLEYLSKLI